MSFSPKGKPRRTLSCIVCKGALYNVFSDAENQPDRGVVFFSYGNYGSTYFDDILGTEIIQVNICDGCLKENESTRVLRKGTSSSAWG